MCDDDDGVRLPPLTMAAKLGYLLFGVFVFAGFVVAMKLALDWAWGI